ncbi:MAG: prolyl oligopeptidase family serine peptidase, partial [Acidimicrobiales bacterium]
LHGHAVHDPYRWLEDSIDPRTEAWSQWEDHRWEDWASAHPERLVWARKLRSLVPDFRSAPTVVGYRRFWMEREALQDHAVLWVEDPGGRRSLIDPNALSPDHTVTLDGWEPSLEGDRVAYLLSSGGDEESCLWIIDTATGELIDGPVDRLRYSSLAWLPGGDTLLYVRRLPPGEVPAGEEAFHRRLWHHRVGEDPSSDLQLFGEGLDKTAYLGVEVSQDGRWAAVTVNLGTAPRNDLYLADLAQVVDPALAGSTLEWRAVLVDADAQAWPHFDRAGRLWLLTDLEAPRRRLCVTDPATPEPGNWVEVVGEDSHSAVLESFCLSGEHLVIVRNRHAASEVSVHDRSTGSFSHLVQLPGSGTADLTGRRDEAPELWVGYTDFATPYEVRALRPEDRRWPGDAPAGVHSREVAFRSADGTEVRMTVVAPGLMPTEPHPTVLYGYGGFNVALTPAYSSSILAWVQAGGVWAVANLRGGSEEGEDWHRAGMRENKQRVFEDFEAAADTLVAGGWTTTEQLGIFGGSNGGLLVGAALTRRPGSYTVVVCSAPLLDMVRYERFGLGATWSDEYGSASDPRELGWLLGYSPYHHVREGAGYPAVLFTIFEGDTRVDPLHARKMATALQWASSSDPAQRPVLVRRETEVGHGARAVQRAIDLAADELTFMADQLGLAIGPAGPVAP